MSQRSAFQVQILEKLGAPLMGAVAEVAARQRKDGEDTQKQEAERLAELLAKTVQVSVGLAGSMDLKDTDGQADSARLALAALAGPLVAGQYRLTAKVPGDAEIKRMVKALEAVLTFSDNFAPAADVTARLENLAPANDENQAHIQYVHSLAPVVNVVAAFSFGRPEIKLIQEVADRLVKKAQDVGRNLAGGNIDKRAELRLLGALAGLYVECHRDEMNRLMAMDAAARAKVESGGMLPMDPVWAAFELRAGMVEILGRAAFASGAASGSAAPKPAAAAAPVTPPPAPPAPPPAPPAPPPAAADIPPAAPLPVAPPPAAPPAQDAPADSGNYNPMGFFKGKKTGEGNG